MAVAASDAAGGTVRRIGAQRDVLGECPLWDERSRALFWVDIRAPAVRRLDHATGRVRSWGMPGLVGSIALAEDGRLAVALPDRIALWKPGDERFESVAAPPLPPGHRFNDGRCDAAGRFWVGTMHNDTRAAEGVLYRLDGDELTEVLDGIRIPNSLAFGPDGTVMYFADSLGHAIDAYDFDVASGSLGEGRVFAKTEPPAFPDGSAVDADGHLWNAEFNGGRLVRYAPDGSVSRVVELPVDRPTCCAFGGPDLELLFVTTTSQNMTPDERDAEPLAGALLVLEPGVRGVPEHRFGLARRASDPAEHP